MKKEIINERKKRDAIQPVIGFSLALIMITLFGIFDVRKYGFEIEKGTETTIFWIVRFLCIVLIPLFVFLLVKFVKQLFNNELFFKVSHEGIYVKISEKHIYNVKYEDIEKVTIKQYPEGPYILFIFLKDPSKYLDEEQIERMKNAKKHIPESGDIAIHSGITKEKKAIVLETINYYLSQLH